MKTGRFVSQQLSKLLFVFNFVCAEELYDLSIYA